MMLMTNGQLISCFVKVMLEYVYGGVFNLHKLSTSDQLTELRKLAKSLNLPELVSCFKNLQVEEISDTEEEEEGETVANDFIEKENASNDRETAEELIDDDGDKIGAGTQALEALVDVLRKDIIKDL